MDAGHGRASDQVQHDLGGHRALDRGTGDLAVPLRGVAVTNGE